jgi:hypothetical protein
MILPPNPVRALDKSLTAAQANGRTVFLGPVTDAVAACDGCHRLSPVQGFFGTGGEQSFEGEPQNAKVPHMRNLYSKIGLFKGTQAGGGGIGDQIRSSDLTSRRLTRL